MMAETPNIAQGHEGTNSPEKDRRNGSERRSGPDRRKNAASDYSGPERRSGTDRRAGEGQ
jgi:hypothetical protein